MRQIALILLVVSLTGCVPHSDNPLTDPKREEMDSSIHGTWFWKESDETGFVHIGLDEESGLLRLIMLDIDAKGKLDVSEYRGHTSLVEENRYLNLQSIPPESGETGYMLVKYETTDEMLMISFIDSETLEKAIQKGSLKGEIRRDKWSSSVQVTEEQEKLRKFVVENDKILFKSKSGLHRLNLPDMDVQQSP